MTASDATSPPVESPSADRAGRPISLDRLVEATARAEQGHFWFSGFHCFVRPFLARAAAGIDRPLILDCGSGTGANLAVLADFGRPLGFDLTWTGLQVAKTQGRPPVARADVTAIPFRSGSFDIVTSFDVLIHLEEADEARAVAEMFRVLRPGGAIVINVAAFNALKGRHSVLCGEVRRYTRARLRAVLERAGFRIVRMTYTNAALMPILLPLRALQRLVERGRDPGDGDFIALPGPLNAALARVLAFEAALVRRVNMPFGSSLLCLASKPADRWA
jgi:SAM-dependent methyltransferase